MLGKRQQAAAHPQFLLNLGFLADLALVVPVQPPEFAVRWPEVASAPGAAEEQEKLLRPYLDFPVAQGAGGLQLVLLYEDLVFVICARLAGAAQPVYV
jgi:hypothetical protein